MRDIKLELREAAALWDELRPRGVRDAAKESDHLMRRAAAEIERLEKELKWHTEQRGFKEIPHG